MENTIENGSVNKLRIVDIKKKIVELGCKIPIGLKRDEMLRYLTVLEQTKKKENEKYMETSLPFQKRHPKQWVTYQPITFHPDIPYKQHLDLFGWAVVPIPNFNADYYCNDFWNFLENYNENIKRNEPTTWTNENLPVHINGIFKQYVGHTKWMWDIREKCVPIFQNLWETSELLTSFDGANFLHYNQNIENLPNEKKRIPPQLSNYPYKIRHWLHADSKRDQTDRCIQGVVTLTDSGPEDGGLIVLSQSHLYFNNYMARHPLEGYTWGYCDLNDPELCQLKIYKICAPKGHLILWDSKLFHANAPPTKNSQIYRMAAYVCMMPKSSCDDKTLTRRLNLYQHGRMTSHAPYGSWFKVEQQHAFVRGQPQKKKIENIEIAPLNSTQLSLVC
jgi:hypothetical protein